MSASRRKEGKNDAQHTRNTPPRAGQRGGGQDGEVEVGADEREAVLDRDERVS